MLILLICILSLSLLVFLILTVWDLVYAISLWISRIGIGRWEDRNEWKESVMNRTRKWLRHTPVAPSTDNRRFILLDILRGEEGHAANTYFEVKRIMYNVEYSGN